MNFLLVIPCRYESKRLRGKALKKIKGREMLSYIWDLSVKAAKKENVIVATDNKKIYDFCKNKSYNVIMTSSKCKTGTDRIYEVSKKIKRDIYINVQGDQPMLKASILKKFIEFGIKNKNSVTTCITKIKNKKDYFDIGIPKMVFDNFKNLLYSSRANIPSNKKNKFINSYKHVCIFSFPRDILGKFGRKKNKTFFESIEDLEINRFLEMGINVKLYEASEGTIDVNYLADLKKVIKLMNN